MKHTLFNIEISFFQKGEKKTINKQINASSVDLAWSAAFNLLPKKRGNYQIRVL